MSWTTSDIPDQTGRVAIVTGANTGIGLETARELARAGAHVVLACRNVEKAAAAVRDIQSSGISTETTVLPLDLSSLDSVRAFAEQFTERFERLDLLVNNAGVMIPPLSRTKEGFELQFGVNHLGHFVLTGLLLPVLERTAGARIVNVSSNAHRGARIDFEDPNWERKSYRNWEAYGQSKLANLLFTLELNKRLEGTGVVSTAAHPGWTYTELTREHWWADLPSRVLGQSAPEGALPTLRAAVDPSAEPNDYYGPSGFMEMRGAPVKVGRSRAARSEETARRLWALSEQLTGTRYERLAA